MAKIVEVDVENEVPGIRYRGVDYAIDPTVAEMYEAEAILKDPEQSRELKSQMRIIQIMIPDLDVKQVRKSEITPIMKAIWDALKNVSSPAATQSG